jgi:hypothetical protein
MLHHREELHMGETHAGDVFGQLRGGLPVSEVSIPFLRNSPPGTEVEFIDGDGRSGSIALRPTSHPLLVPPLVIQIPDDRSCPRRDFVTDGKGIRFLNTITVKSGGDKVLVAGSFSYIRNETLPYARLPSGPEGVGCIVPPVKIADNEDPLCVRGPHGKVCPLYAGVMHQVTAQFVVELQMAAFVKKIEVVIGESGTVVEDGSLSLRAFLYSRFIHAKTPLSGSASLHRNSKVPLQ